MNKSKIDVLCEYLNNNTAKQYPVPNKELSGSTDYIKNGYLKMLAVILQQSGTVSDAQLEMFKRIVAGAMSENTAEDFLRMALDIEIEDYINFADECKDLQLKYRWVLDAVILTCVQERTPEQLKLIAQFCESFGVSKAEVKYIAAMAKAIVGMQVSDYVTAYEIKEDSIPDVVFSDYMYLISNSCVCHNEHMTIFQPSCKEEVTVQALEKIREANTPCIKIIGAVIEVDSCKLDFIDKEKVILEGCCFTESNKNSIEFIACKEIIIRNCKFTNFSTRTLIFNNVDTVLMDGCEFTNCKMKYYDNSYDWQVFGGVIYSDRPSSVGRFDLINTSFSDCGGINKAMYFKSAFISNIKSFVDKCSFTNCWHFSKARGLFDEGSSIDQENEKRTMFTKDSSATNCRYENSALFN